MPVFYIGRDFETAERVGAVGTFQLDLLLDEEENDITNTIDVGKHFHTDADVKRYLSEVLEIPLDDIELEDA